MFLRLALFTGSAIVAAWFAWGWVQARDIGLAETLIGSPRISAGQAREAASLLRSAGELNPDWTVDILRAKLAETQHHLGAALIILNQVTRAEPQNLEAWRELGVDATHLGRRALAQTAFVHVLHLVGYHR
jgi:Flp pilus assembly protein TadD